MPVRNDNGKVLVVDDEARVRRLIAAVLKRRGIESVEAANGRSALDHLAEDAFDLIITDLQMPEMDGLALLEQCRALYPETDVLVLTAYGTVQSAVYAMKHGALDYATKPFGVEELGRKVDQCFEQRRMRLEARKRSPFQPLVELGHVLSSEMDLQDALEATLKLLQQTFEPDASEVLIFGEGLQGDTVEASEGLALSDLGYPARPTYVQMVQLAQQPEPWLLRDGEPIEPLGYRPQSGLSLIHPLVSAEKVVGALILARSPQRPRYTRDDAELLRVFGFQIGISLLHARTRQRLLDTFRDLKKANLSAVETLFAALETYDQYTHDHSERVARYANLLGQRLGLSADDLETLHIAALLHDIGKLGIGDETLNKPGGLTASEFDRVKMHPMMAARIVSGVDAFIDVVPLLLHHHERFDGQGYPDGLRGYEIPLGSRIIAVVDAFDSMTSNRPYRAALSQEDALDRLRSIAGSQLDSGLVEEWIALVEARQVVRDQGDSS